MIAVKELSKNYASVRALRGITFEVDRGEVVGFLGPNGAGKTTTLRILTGFMPATDGEATVGGFDVVSRSRDVRRSVGYLPEDVPLYRDLTVESFLRYMGGLKEIAPARRESEIERVIHLTGLESVRRLLIGKCSKGFRQRTGLAMALLGDPPVLLLDEPTSGLDPNQVVEVRDLIRELSGEKTVLLSSHILSEVAQICGRVLIIHEGRLVAAGTPADLADRIELRRMLRVRVRGTLDPARWLALSGVRAVEPAGDSGAFLVEVESPEEAAPRVARAVVEAGGSLVELRHELSDLEAVFRRVTAEDGGV